MYSLLFCIYVLGFRVVSCFHKKARKMVVGQRETWKSLAAAVKSEDKWLWFHAASLGEFEQGRPLMEAIRQRYPAYKILLTFYSPSGYEVQRNYAGADLVCYLPFDTPCNVRRFFRLIQPKSVFFIKYEFWPNYLKQLKKKDIPTYLVSGIFRPTQTFFKPWGRIYRKVFSSFSYFFVQNQQSIDLLASVGIRSQAQICGDTRSDRVLAIASEARNLFLLDEFHSQSAHSRILVAGSSWPQDEQLFIDYFNRHPELKLILAPHQIHEAHIQAIESMLQRPALRYSRLTEDKLQGADCIILDCYGLLSSTYRYGDIAYIGGGFGVGIHNTLEAAVYGIPLVFGPNYHKFDEAKALLACGAARSISRYEELEECLQTWTHDAEALRRSGEAAVGYVRQSSGGTKLILSYLEDKL